MFLPVILQKDFGHGAWLLFITLNIIGATGFVFFITTQKQSTSFIDHHNIACLLFSVVTILFQLFFIGWVGSYLSFVELAVGLCVLATVWLSVRYVGLSATAVAVWFLSIFIVGCYVLLKPELRFVDQLINQVTKIDHNVFFAFPLLALGFLLCPYLDLTFHQVVQEDQHNQQHGNRLSFLVGFPLLFGVLMLFSLMYVDTAKQMLVTPRQLGQESVIIKMLFLYFLMQTGFTIIAHVNQLQGKITSSFTLPAYVGVMLIVALGFLCQPSINEIVYRCFMSFYGIIAPAYVWMRVLNKKYVSTNSVMICIVIALLLSSIPMFLASPQYYYLYICAVLVVIIAPFLPAKK